MKDYTYVDYIANLVNDLSGENPFENTRSRPVVEARALLVYILREVEGYTYHAIKDYFNSKGKAFDHATALHAYRSYPMYSKYNKKLDEWFNLLIDSSNVASAKKIQAKILIDSSDPSVADLFVYMVKKAV